MPSLTLEKTTINEYLAQLIDIEGKNDKSKAVLAAAKDYEHISASAAKDLSNAYGRTAEELGLIYNNLTQEYSIDPKRFKDFVNYRNLWGDFSTEEYNEILKTIDEYDRKNDPTTILADIIANRNKLSEANIAAIAKLFNMEYDEVLAMLDEDAEGNRTISLAQLQEMKENSDVEFGKAVETAFIKEYDAILTKATGLVSTQTKGYTSVSDMAQFQNWLGADSFEGLYAWSDVFHSFVLTDNGIVQSARKAKAELESSFS